MPETLTSAGRPTREQPAAGAGRIRGIASGLLAGGVTLAVAELVAGALLRPSSPVLAVGSAFIDLTPRPLKDFAVTTFGQNDKNVLLTGIGLTLVLLTAVVGLLARRRPRIGDLAVLALTAVAVIAAVSRPTARGVDVLPALAGGVVGLLTLRLLLGHLTRPGGDRRSGPVTRRAFLAMAGAVGLVAVVSEAAGRQLRGRLDAAAARRGVSLPRPASPAPAWPQGAELPVPGITPLQTAATDFYRVDTALSVPQLRPQDWQLVVHGLVDRPLTLSFADLLAMPAVERDITMTCVSNEVGGTLVGSARWQGVLLADVLARAGVQPEASQLFSRSVDGMTIGTPVSAVTDGRDALLAYAMNGAPLLPEHGFPVRMVVPGLYGYVSATKWVTDLELTTFERATGYWVQRGWAAQAPIRIGSRIDTPKPLSRTPSGDLAVAGVAWAQHRGISAVQVQLDDGPWQQAQLSAPVDQDTWRQWVWRWRGATPGTHRLTVRAVDGHGDLQVQQRETPFPAGATGWHSIIVTVTA